jgi:hypothetical protein
MLSHRHSDGECRAAYAAWNGVESPLRHQAALSSCGNGDHQIFWTVEARGEREALAQLPPYLASRTEVSEVREVAIP